MDESGGGRKKGVEAEEFSKIKIVGFFTATDTIIERLFHENQSSGRRENSEAQPCPHRHSSSVQDLRGKRGLGPPAPGKGA